MRQRVWIPTLAAVFVACLLAVSPRQAAGQAHEHAEIEGAGCFICDFKRDSAKALPWLKWGADFRIRGIWDKNTRATGNDILRDETVGNERFWQRYRTRAWAIVTPIENVDLEVGMAWEWYNFCRPKGHGGTYDDIRDTSLDEAIIEKLNVKWSKAFGLPMTIQVGRQFPVGVNDWLLIEGTPLDGTRTAFFDMARVTYELEEFQTTVDGLFIWQCSDQDRWLRPVNDRDRAVVENDEVAAMLNIRNKSFERTQLDGYYIWRKTNQETAGGWNSDISTVGGSIRHEIDESWKVYAELATQIGNKEGVNVCAMGFNSKLSYHLNDEWNNNFRVGYEYRSGSDEPDGAFDILWGRGATWSNIVQGYLDRMEGAPAMTPNIHRLNAGWSCKPTEKMGLHFDYHLLLADNNQRPHMATPAQFSSNGNIKGQLFQALMTYDFNEHISGHLIGEYFCPGNFYSDRNNDAAIFLRYQLILKF